MERKRYFRIKVTAVGFAALLAIGLSPSAFAIQKSHVSQELPTPAYEVLNHTSAYTKMLLSKEVVVENGEQVGIINSYMYIPRKPIMPTTDYLQSVYEDEFLASNAGYVRLTGYFMYDYKKVSCYDTSVTHDVSKYKEESLKIQGNGTSKSTVELSFSFNSMLGESNKKLSVSCTKDGKSS